MVHDKIKVKEVRDMVKRKLPFDEATTREKSKAAAGDFMEDVIRKAKAVVKETNDICFIAGYMFRAPGISDLGHREEIEVTDTCPEPVYNQCVFKLNPKTDNLEFEWALPSEEVSLMMYSNRFNPNMQNDELLPYVMDKISGELIKKARDYNYTIIEKVKNERRINGR